jgi:MFS family permease
MSASNSFGALFATRFLLGLFEAGCFPLFSIIVGHWYRRSEQPVRIAAFYSTNGFATIVAAALSYGLAQIQNPALAAWRVLFLAVGLLTVASAFPIWWFMPDDVATAWFLTEEERLQAVERLRVNQTGHTNREFKWKHLSEICVDPKTYLFVAITLSLNVCTQVTNTFGPLILQGLGFTSYRTALLNMPFGAMQIVAILSCAWICQKTKLKSVVLLGIAAPVMAGLIALYVLPRGAAYSAGLLVGYYLVAFCFGGNAPIASWIVGNTGGTTKTSAMMALNSAASATGNIVGPLLFNTEDAPAYLPGLGSVLALIVLYGAAVVSQTINLYFLNCGHRRTRVANGKPAILKDHSMEDRYVAIEDGNEEGVGQNALTDLTDRENDEFIYIY